MKDSLVLRIPAQLEDTSLIEWAYFSVTGVLRERGEATLSELQASRFAQLSADELEVVVLVPGELVLLTSVDIPSTQLKQIRQALPFMVEEKIADDIENVHIAIPEPLNTSEGPVPVAVVSHRLLIDWLDALYTHDIQPDVLSSEILVLGERQLQQADVAVVIMADEAVVRYGKFAGVKLPVEQLDMLDGILAQEAVAIDQIGHAKVVICDCGDDELARAKAQQLAEVLGTRYEVKRLSYREDAFEVLATAAVTSSDTLINLMQGGYKTTKKRNTLWNGGPLLVAGFACLLVAQLLFSYLGGWYFNSRAEALDDDAKQLYRSFFPDEKRVVNPRRQLANKLRGGTGSTAGNADFLSLLNDVSVAGGAHFHSNGNETLQITQMLYSAEGTLLLELRCKTIEQLQAFQQTLSNSGLNTEIQSANSGEDVVVGRVKIARSLS